MIIKIYYVYGGFKASARNYPVGVEFVCGNNVNNGTAWWLQLTSEELFSALDHKLLILRLGLYLLFKIDFFKLFEIFFDFIRDKRVWIVNVGRIGLKTQQGMSVRGLVVHWLFPPLLTFLDVCIWFANTATVTSIMAPPCKYNCWVRIWFKEG